MRGRCEIDLDTLEPVLLRAGGHDWTVWSPATTEILRRVEQKRRAADQRSP